MDLKDIDKEIDSIKIPGAGSKQRIGADLNVKHAGLKVIAARLLSLFLFAIIVIISIYTVLKTRDVSGQVNTLAVALVLIYFVLGGMVSLKLWNIEYIGWLAMFFISLAGVFLPVLSMFTRGIAIGTIPIILVSLSFVVTLLWVKDLFGIKRMGDIFKPY